MPALEPEFYVGYQPTAPSRLASLLRALVVALALVGLALAALLATAQAPFVSSRFEFLRYRQYRGTLFEWPYPLLVSQGRQYLLVIEGKHGAGPLTRGLDGTTVSLEGALIENGEDRMLELLSGSLKPAGLSLEKQEAVKLGSVTLTGEIVDTKCHFGVMNPGRGKVHRDCAARCLSGGVPPGFLVRDGAGVGRVFLLTGGDGRQIGKELLAYAGEPVTLSGELVRVGTLWVLKIELAGLRRE